MLGLFRFSLATLRSVEGQENIQPNFVNVYTRTFSVKMSTFKKFQLYKDVDEILNDLEVHKEIPAVQSLLDVYNASKIPKGPKKHPLIVLEGLDGSGKSSMAKELAKEIHAALVCTPPKSIRHISSFYENHLLRNAFFYLGNYIASYNLYGLLDKQPVVMDRFWHTTTAYALAQKVADNPGTLELPDPSDPVYQWPSDLCVPDKVILMDVSEEKRLERISSRGAFTLQEMLLKDDNSFRRNVLQAYKNMRNPELKIVDGNLSYMETVYLLKDEVTPLLQE